EVGSQLLSQELLDELEPKLRSLRERALEELPTTPGEASPEVEIALDLSYAGSETLLTFPIGTEQELRSQFTADHLRLFGYNRGGHPIVVVRARAQAHLPSPHRIEQIQLPPSKLSDGQANVSARIWMSGSPTRAAGYHEGVPVLWRAQLTPEG